MLALILESPRQPLFNLETIFTDCSSNFVVPDPAPEACSAIASSVSAGEGGLGNSLAITALSSILVLSRVI